ncbi:hypothetical protein [Sphingomonas sanguinis]|uniref:hypothetical protein n=1 Tax=Sphingomonas sanguinis TaxID=33051 RepID=UPI00077BC48C|nr:hypothetical protein [Sphingomonas sanguinis]
MSVAFRRFFWFDAIDIAVQPSQWVQAGIDARYMSEEQARDLARRGPAWTAIGDDGRLLCCAGITEIHAGRQGVAWAMLAADLGVAQHLAITRFAKAQIAASPLIRVESLISDDPTGRCVKWASAVGLEHEATLACWGAASETVYLYRRIAPCRL